MPISTVLIANTIDFARQVINQVSANLNYLLATTYRSSGNILVNVSNNKYVSLNVGTGIIYGNGAGLFSVPASALTAGKIPNSKLQNSSFLVAATAGVTSSNLSGNLGSTISLVSAPINSITNTRTDMPVSANAAPWANSIILLSVANASLINTGILSTSVGGIGKGAAYANGQILIGNNTSLSSNFMLAGEGIIATYGPGAISLSANIIQGPNTLISLVDPANPSGAYVVSVNAPPRATLTTAGTVILENTLSSNIDTAATPALVNSIYGQILTAAPVVLAPNRLIAVSIYSTAGRYTWNIAPKTDIVEITLVGAGGPGGRGGFANGISSGGSSGQVIEMMMTRSQLNVKAFAANGGSASTNSNTIAIIVGAPTVGAGYGTYTGTYATIQANSRSVFGYYPSGNILVAEPGRTGSTGTGFSNLDGADVSKTLGTQVGNGSTTTGILYRRDSFTEFALPGMAFSASSCMGGRGGGNPYGRGGDGAIAFDAIAGYTGTWPFVANGQNGLGFGAGGGGSVHANGPISPVAISYGGNGAGGVVIVREYSGS